MELHPILSTLRAIRNGSLYGMYNFINVYYLKISIGSKIRAPHALVMIFLFRQGTVREKLRQIVRLTFQHTKNLALFVGVYKAMLSLLCSFHVSMGLKVAHGNIGLPAQGWHAALAGGVGGYLVWSKYSSVNYQIVMYLLSRIIISFFRKMAKDGIYPWNKCAFDQVYPILAVSVWASVMYLYEEAPSTLHGSLKKSMDFLYHDSNTWEKGISDFLPSPLTAIVCALTIFKF